ncbi:CU044_5270 family protein [Actinomycetes bacterium KLBMP 9797]
MNMLRELGESLAPPGSAADDPRPPADLRRRVLTTAARRRRPRWTIRTRLAWQLGVVAAGALTLAVLLAPHAYRTGSAPPHAGGASDAATVLRLAAQRSAAAPAPARPDQYVFIESVGFQRVGRVPGPGTEPSSELLGPQRTYTWWPATFGRDGYYRMLPPYHGRSIGAPKGDRSEKPTEGTLGFLGTPPALSSDADQMYAYLYRVDPEDTRDLDWTPDQLAWDRLATTVLPHSVVNPAAQAAALRAAQRIAGVEVRENVTDAAGRTGVAVTRAEDNLRLELIFDAKTYRYLGHNLVWTAGRADMGIKAGDVASSVAYTRTAFVDKLKQLP